MLLYRQVIFDQNEEKETNVKTYKYSSKFLPILYI